MGNFPPVWTKDELVADIEISSGKFRSERLTITDAWESHFNAAKKRFDALFNQFKYIQLAKADDQARLTAFKGRLTESLRYLAGPPISEDDLKVIADVESLSVKSMEEDPAASKRVFEVIEQIVDPFRFPWLVEGRAPSPEEEKAALMASSILMAAQSIATERRMEGKNEQENKVKEYLNSIGFKEVPPETITTIVKGPQHGQFCGECQLGQRKADIVVRLHDTRLMAIECKVSNSALNSVKRINNDAAVKAVYWLHNFGVAQVVPAAVLSGVFKMINLKQAQERGLSLVWAHDLEKLGAFIDSTRTT